MKIFSLMDRRNNVRILTVLGVMLMSSVRLMADSFTIDGINYSTTSDTEVTVTGGSVTGALDIPSVVTYGEKQYAVTSIGSSAFYRNFSITSVHIPGSVRTIGSQAFYDNYYMSSIVIDEGVDRIEFNAFGYNGNSLGSNSCNLSLPNSITYIGTQAFQNNGCFNITILDLPESLSFIGQGAFRNCSSALEEIVFHGSVTEIQSNSFGGLSNLKSVWVLSSSIPSTTNGDPFNGSQYNATLYVPSSLLESYRSANYWKDFAKFENCNNHPEYMKPIVVFDRTTWQISISCLNPDATIYFTKDDTTPTISSDTYTSPFFYDGNITVVKAIAVCEGFDNSEVVSLNLDTSSLFLSPQPVVTMSSDFTVTMECAMPGATIYYYYGEFYSWQDENSRISQSTLYEGPFTLPYATKLSVEAIADGYAPSGWTTVDYYTNYYVEQPYISSEQVIDVTYRTVKSRTVSIDYYPTNTYGGTGAYYTIDGSDPNTSSTRVKYTGPFNVDRNCKVRAVAVMEGRINSQISEHSISDVDSQFKVDGIYYNLVENTIGNYVEVTTGGLPYSGDIVIPETVTDADGNAYTVVRIGRNAFNHSNGHDITSISLPATIESIGEYAFNDCDNITSITLPSGVKSIERYAFYDCNNLEDISLGESLVSIGECAFYNCRNLTSLSLPATLWEIESQAFNCCYGLTTIELPNAIHTIGSSAFAFCDNLTSIVIPEGVTVIPSSCFQYCRSLANVTLPSTLQEIKNYAFHECDALTTIDLPDAVSTLGNYAICNCSNLISVSMPNALTSMGYNVFESCDKLTSIAIPEGVTVIPSSAFWNCRSLTSVSLPSTVREIQYGAFYNCDNLTAINLPSNVQSIGGQAFSNCSDLTSINLPASLTSLEYNVFEQCSKLTSIVIPEGITVIPSNAFNNCSSLASVTLPSTLKTINSSAFYNCSSLNSIILPASLENIYENAFNGCSALTSVYSYASTPPAVLNQPHAFTGVLTNANLYVSPEAVNTYKGAKIWQDFLSVGTVGVLPCAFQLNNCSLSISSQTEGASIYYTRDGSEPTASSTLYEGPIDFLVSDTIRAIAVKEGLGNSPVAVFQQELKVESPVVSIDKDLVITITPAEKPSEKLADVRYYYNYSEDRWGWPVSYSKPEEVIANCTLYTEPLHPEKPGHMRVYAMRDGWTMSVTEFNYFDGYYLDSPSIDWNSDSREVSISHGTEGVTIYYTRDGSDPNTSDTRAQYTGPFTVDRNCTICAVAVKDGAFDAQVNKRTISDVDSQFKVDGIYYNLVENTIGNYVEVTTGGLPYSGDIVIPETVTDAAGTTYTVIRIDRNAFAHNYGHNITSISLPATIESIGEYAFNDCDNITSITLPSGVKSIEQYTFNDCNNLEEINLGESLVNLGGYAFAYCRKLTSLSLPATLQEIKSHAFYDCDGLTTIELPDAIHTIGYSAFASCDNLSAITMPSSLTSLGNEVFQSCGKLASIAIPEGVTVIPLYAFNNCRSLASVTLPSTLQEIKDYAFRDCDALTTIDLPDAIHTIGYYAFGDCDNLNSITMPSSLTSIGEQAFWSCNKLASIAIPEGVTVIPLYAFYNCSSLASVSLPSNVQSIGRQAFANCSNLTSINLPASLTSLEYNVFEQCQKLTSIVIPDGVTVIPSSAFYNCSSLASVTLPATLKTINSSAFQNCSSLNSVILPASLTEIYENAFNGCSALTSVYSYASNPPLILNTPHAFTGVLTNANLYVNSEEAVNTYKGAKIWQDFLSVETVGVLPCTFQFNDYTLSISCQTEGASIYYTRDGSEPSASGTLYEGPIDFLVNGAIRAIAVKEGLNNSPISEFRHEFKVERPVVSIDKELVITITSEKPSEKLTDVRYYYNYSQNSNWPVGYSTPEDVVANCTLFTEPLHPEKPGRMRVYAMRDGWAMSDRTDFDYYNDYYLAQPDIDWNSDSREVSISHGTEGVTIYYTRDGSDPNTSDTRAQYTGPFTVDRNCTICAVAVKDGAFDTQVNTRTISDVDSQFKVDGIYYNLVENTIGNYVEVTTGGLPYSGDIVIPETVTNASGTTYTVIRIGHSAFNHSNGHNINTVSLPATIESIGGYAFYDCDNLKSITLPSGVKSIEQYAFYDCNNLADINLGESLVSLGEYAFAYCRKLADLSLPATLQEIKPYTFHDCDGLTALELPDAIHTIGSNAFAYCDNLSAITMPSSLTSLGNEVFQSCGKLASIAIPEGVTVIPSSAFNNCRSLASVTLPSTIKEIKSDAFNNCDGLTALELPDAIHTIDSNAFSNCDNLNSITMPSSLTSIGSYAFQNCNKLASIAIPEGVTVIPSYAFNNCSSLASVSLPSTVREIQSYAFNNCDGLTTLELPDAIHTIGSNAFDNCDNLNSITMPSSLTSIGSSAFRNCNKLTSIAIPEGVTVIPSSAFYNCSSLASVTLPSTLKTINSSTFYNCSNLNSVILPASLENIYESAFNGCSALTSVYSYASNPPAVLNQPHAFTGILTNANLYVIPETVEDYKGAKIWQDFKSIEPIGVLPCTFQFNDYTLSISCQTEGASIYYTRDGSEPSASGTLYEGPIDFLVNGTIRAIAVKEGLNNSPISEFRHEFKVERPVVSIDKELVITITSEKPNEKLTDVRYYYNCSQNSNWPSIYSTPENVIANCTLYTEPLHPEKPGRMRVYAMRDGWTMSDRTDFDYYNDYYLAQPGIDWNSDSREVSISHGTEGVTIYYTRDGSDPNTSDTRAQYTDPFTVDRNCTICAVAVKDGAFDAQVNKRTISDVDSQFKVDGIYYNLAENTIGNYVEVTTGGLPYSGDIVIPETVTDESGTTYTVIRIGRNAFNHSNGHDITSISLPATIESIGEYAFNDCDNITSITLPSGVKSIERYAFYDCNNLADINLGESLLSLGEFAFSGCRKLADLSLPATLQEIQHYAFYDCDALTTIDLPDAVHTIGYSAFAYCDNLSAITMPSSLTSLGNEVFQSCGKLASIAIPEGVTVIPSSAFNNCRSLASVTLPSTIKEIKSYAFCECDALTTIDMPDALTSIGDHAFGYCDRLTSITIPEGVTVIPSSAFFVCSSLASVSLPSTLKEIQREAFYLCDDLTAINLPSNVQSIGGQAFANCSNLTSINLPASLTSLEYNVFENCPKLTSIAIPEGVTAIPGSAFYNCSGLASVSLPSTLKTINSSAFYNCSNLTSIILPASLENIYESAFNGCSALTSVYSYASNPPAIQNQPHAFTGILTNANLYVIPETVEDYKGAKIWQDFKSIEPIGVLPCTFQFNDYTLSISCQTEGASIYYTRDGSEPSASGTLYTGPIDFLVSDTIRAIAVKEGLNNSPISEFRHEFKVERPVVSIDKELVITITSVKPSEKLTDVRYYYNCSYDRWSWPMEYSTPEDVVANCTLYTEPLHIEKPGRMRVFAMRDGWTMSDRTDFDYFNDYYLDQPGISWNSVSREVRISHGTEGVTIYYTLDGTDPNTSDSRKVYTEAIILEPNTRVLAVATMKDRFNSSVSEFSNGNWYSFEQNGIFYRITSNTEVSVSGGSATGALDFPEKVTCGEKQYAVTSIGSNAFYSNKSITSVHIPGSVKTIGSNAFYDNYYMSSIVIDEGVDRIENDAFGYNGNSLGSNSCNLSLPNSITYIGTQAFQNNGCFNITILDLPESLSFIGQGAFRNCSSALEEIVFHGSVTEIQSNSFGGLSNLKSVWVLSSSIPSTTNGDPFNGSQYNATLYVPSSLMESYKSANYWNYFAKYESFTDPVIRINGITWQISINCIDNQGSVIHYTTDGTEPTESCDIYTAPFIYDGNISVVKAIAVSETSGISEVSTLIIDKSTLVTHKPVVTMSSDFTVTMECALPGATIYYHYGEFYSSVNENSRISQSTLYQSPFKLSYGTKLSVEAIADGYAPSGWTTVDYYTNYYVESPDISSEQIIDGKYGTVTSRTVSIDCHPNNTYGGTGAYYTIDGSDPNTSSTRVEYTGPFTVDRNCKVRAVAVMEGRINSQISEHSISDVDSQFKVDGIYYNLAENTIGNYVEVTYGAISYVGDIVIPETITKDGTKFTVVRIGNNAFDRNQGNEISSINLPATIQSIGEYAFNYCDKLVSIVLPDGVKTVGRGAFNNCYNLEDISLGTSLEYLGQNAFASCSKLLGIKLPDTLKSLESGIFQGCSKLTSIAIPEGVTEIPSNLFSRCSNLTSVSMPSTLKTIRSDAFNSCNNLTSVILPASLTEIYENAFNSCSSITSVYSFANVPPALRNEPHAFKSILTKTTLYVNPEAVDDYKDAKIWQDFLSVKPVGLIPCNPPTFSCENFLMTISCTTPDAVIYYTIDGSDPTESATRIKYTGPFGYALNDIPLYAVATKDGMADSDIPVYRRNLIVSDPMITRNGKNLTITTQTPDAKIYYVVRKDKFEPTWNHGNDGRFNSYNHNTMFREFHLYDGVATIPYAGTIYAIAIRDGWANSQCMYMDTGDGMTLNPPVISSDEKTRLVTITLNNDKIEDVKCYYTLDGEDPNYSSTKQLYEKPFTIDRNYTIQAIVTKEDYFNSSIATKPIDWFQTSKPEIKITVLPDENKVMAEIICNGVHDSIFYSLTTSVDKKSPVYKELVELTSSSATISAMAVRDGWKDSEKASFTFRKSDYTCKTPTFTENKKDSTLSISSSEGASIYYTVDGKTPSKQSAKYTAPIKIEHNQTIRAIAYHTNLLTSQEGEHDISWVELNSPRIVINGNICTITSDKPGATIRYALSDDHLRDTQIDYQVYSGPFQLSKKQTDIGAYATLTNYNDSKVAWKTFTPGEDASCQKPQIIRDGETDYVIMSSGTDDAVIYYTLNGLTPNTKSDKYTGPIPVSSNVTVMAMSTAYGYFDSDITTFNVDWFTLPVPEISIDGNCAIISCLSTEATIYYTLDGKNPTTKSAVYTEPVLLTGNVEIRAMAVLKGWNNSDVAVFTPNSFVCDEVQFDYDGYYLVLSTDDGSTIHYTTDGSEPTENGLIYTEPIVISDFITVKAMSSKPFYADSPVSSYEITFISDGEDATINCEAGQLQKIINQTGSSDGLTALTIKGSINQADLAFIRTIESLEHLDLTEVTVDEFGFQDNAFEGMNLISFSSPKSHVKVGEHIFQDCDGLAAIVWNMDESVPENLLEDTDNPNMLLYVNAITYRPKSYSGNLISGGQATEIVLVDSETGGNFYCPQRFYAKKISFTRSFEQTTEIGITQGWETIALPFDVKTITHETKGALAPFAKGLDKDEFKPFWLCELTSTGFIDASEIKAYTPYLICMPNNDSYADDYILSGKVTFSSEEIYIDENQDNASIKGSVEFTTSLQRRAADPSVMNINLEEITDEFGDWHRTGSAFISGLRETRPFEASAVINVSLSSLRVDNIANGFVTDILKTYSDDLLLKSDTGIFDTDGRKLDIEDLNSLRLQIDTEKIYIIDGRKVLVTPLR